MMTSEKAKDVYATISPANGELVSEYAAIEDHEVQQKLDTAIKGHAYLSKLSLAKRKEILLQLADKIEEKSEQLAQTVTLEMGKPITQARAEIQKCAGMCRWHAENADTMMATETVEFGDTRFELIQESRGPVLFISTWNNPVLQATLAIVPQIVAGNSALVKPAPSAPKCVLAMEQIIDTLDLPEKIYVPVLTSIPQTESLISDDAVKGVTLIGSTKAGHRIGELAGKGFKPAVLDAGGSDPFIVLEDADIKGAAKCAAAGRFGNTGQSCVAAKRIIVQASVYDKFLEAFLKETKSLKMGDPFDDATVIGPVAKHAFRDEMKRQVDESVAQGAKLLLGGDVPDDDGAYLNPTILTDVTTDMVVAQEEVFGPVGVVFKVNNTEEAIALANDTPFGLGASIWSAKPEEIIPQLDVCNVAVNGKVATAFPVPFGGKKESGHGVYFGTEGVRTFTNTKVVSYPKS